MLRFVRLIKMGMLAALILGMPAKGAEQGTDISLTIMASQVSWSDSQYVGHAFLCIGLRLKSGVKEDCLGFYPASIKSFIGGPGVVDSEFSSKRPDHWANVTISVQKDITAEQRKAIYKAADDYNAHGYRLTDSNCIDFADRVAQIAGWHRPQRASLQFPVDYVAKLKALNP